jgi:hypothetical protein
MDDCISIGFFSLSGLQVFQFDVLIRTPTIVVVDSAGLFVVFHGWTQTYISHLLKFNFVSHLLDSTVVACPFGLTDDVQFPRSSTVTLIAVTILVRLGLDGLVGTLLLCQFVQAMIWGP